METTTFSNHKRWRLSSIAIIVATWMILQIGGLFTPGLLDDVDSVYLQIAREMLGRHDYVTPTIDGIRFFDKPPLMYWAAAGSMRLFGEHDWAARIPLALSVLALLLAVYALGIRLYADVSPKDAPDRGGLYSSLALATSIGAYLYTRFYIPDVPIALWVTLGIHLFLIALDRVHSNRSTLWPSIGFGAVMALDVLTKGLIGLIFPLAFAVLYLVIVRIPKAVRRLNIPACTLVFLIIAAPWHILAALRNPAIVLPAGVGLPAKAGWAWFYLYNEHIARALSKRIPQDYGNVPRLLFWLLLVLWLVPWAAFLPVAVLDASRSLRNRAVSLLEKQREAALTTSLWALVVLGFFTVAARQEYYHLPALPALALMVGGLLAAADWRALEAKQVLRGSLYVLVPLGLLLAAVCGYFAITAPTPAPGVTLDALLSSNPNLYTLSLGHVFDLTGQAMGLFRGPLTTVALGMVALGPVSHLLRKRTHTFAANMLITAGMTAVLLAAHEGLVRFYPILGSKDLALAIKADGLDAPVLIDGELTSGSSLLFYLDNPVLLVNGRINGPWFGSFWPDARPIFLSEADLFQEWHSRYSLYLMTYHPEQRIPQLCKAGPVIKIASSGGKTVLRNNLASPQEPAHIAGINLCVGR